MISVVLRLAPAALAEGRIAGEAVVTETGRRALVASAEELVAFVRAHQTAEPDPVQTPRTKQER